MDDRFTRFTKKNAGSTCDHACLPPVQFRVDLRELYRQKGYDPRFAEMVFFVAVWTQAPQEQAAVVFRLALSGAEVVVPTLPVTRTAARAEAEGVPICAVVLDRQANRLGPDTVEVTVSLSQGPIKLAATGQGIWKAVVRGMRPGEHRAELRATWKDGSREPAVTRVIVRITDGQFVGYDPQRRLLTRGGKHLGPITGCYIPGKDTEIAARHGGRMLFVEDAAAPRSALADWQTEAKTMDLAVLGKGDPPRPPTPQAAAGLRLWEQSVRDADRPPD